MISASSWAPAWMRAYRTPPGNAQHADHLDLGVAGLGRPGGPAGLQARVAEDNLGSIRVLNATGSFWSAVRIRSPPGGRPLSRS
jgi:hypothetical protein